MVASASVGSKGRTFLDGLNIAVIKPRPVYVPDRPKADPIGLNEYRSRLHRMRLESVGSDGAFLDRSGTGTGKTTADMRAIAESGVRALLVMPTHVNCEEVESDLRQMGVDAKAYPARLTEDKRVPCTRCKSKAGDRECPICCGTGMRDIFANCSNTDADDAEALGLPVVKTICSSCAANKRCRQDGYLADLRRATEAHVAIATHARAAWGGLSGVAKGRRYIGIHEDAVDLLRPSDEVSPADLRTAREILDRMLDDPIWLDWFGSGKTVDERERRNDIHEFIAVVAVLVGNLDRQLGATETTVQLTLPQAIPRPKGVEAIIFRASRDAGAKFSGQPWRLLLAATAGELHQLGAVIDVGFRRTQSKKA